MKSLQSILLSCLVMPLAAIVPFTASSLAVETERSTSTFSSNLVAQRQLQVFFPQFPDAANNFTKVVPVLRTTSSSKSAQFAIGQLIAGPTTAEQQRGLQPAVRLTGASNCGRDFTLSITNRLARLQFCRQVVSKGIGDDARARSAIEATLKQFSSVNRVVILEADGSCFADQSGEKRCFTGL